MNSQIQISDLENIISEKIFIKIEKWNLYLGDAGLARNLALECISNLDKGSKNAAITSLEAINVKIGDGDQTIQLSKLITSSQICDLEEILDNL
ncbi:conserved hypothetical protein [Prochlorococcus marinus str. MIT 9515]|uniref:DUF3181 domain-containing protein n=1 Tax=Prochlorococcus marinus (strain MIT 9515) TaxID=167542 RepID=A2BUP1_PROM5|nr:DUF3181 family protein [Prochlorococcus marinus]ABM71502.1 conserved hypothetical protein [Prochlorococcus marinus str. MIT 9515]